MQEIPGSRALSAKALIERARVQRQAAYRDHSGRANQRPEPGTQGYCLLSPSLTTRSRNVVFARLGNATYLP